jgi:hypothetical protein
MRDAASAQLRRERPQLCYRVTSDNRLVLLQPARPDIYELQHERGDPPTF